MTEKRGGILQGKQRIHRHLLNRHVFRADPLEETKDAVRWDM